MEDPRGKHEGDPCPNCGHPRRRGGLCPRCHTRVVRRAPSADSDRPTSEMPVIPQFKLQRRHVCGIPPSGRGHCVHCDTGYTCPGCGHRGMQTKECKPPYFILRCPVCGREMKIHWIKYDLTCPRCGKEGAFGTYSKLLEPIIQCPDCGPSPKKWAAQEA